LNVLVEFTNVFRFLALITIMFPDADTRLLVFSGHMLLPNLYIPETPNDDPRTEMESVRASPTPSPTCRLKEPDSQRAAV
jgi:hypothetical protein